MSIFKAKIKEEVIEDIDLMGMTYTEYVSQELNREVNKLIVIKKKIETLTGEMIADIKQNGETHELITKFHDFNEKAKFNDVEIEKTKRKYEVDINLLSLAVILDRADMENKGVDLIWELGPKINEIIALLPAIEKCFGGTVNTPYSYMVIKNAVTGLPRALNNSLSQLVKIDKEKLIQRFNKEVAALEKKKNETKIMKNKYIL